MERNVSRTSLFDCQRPLKPYFGASKDAQNSTLNLAVRINCFECSTSGGAKLSNRFGLVSISCMTCHCGCIALSELFSVAESQESFGGGEGVRTPDLRLAKPALCQTELRPQSLKGWLRGRDLNPRPLGYEPNELPDCSTPRHPNLSLDLVGLGRFELPTSRLSGVRSNQLSYRPPCLLCDPQFWSQKRATLPFARVLCCDGGRARGPCSFGG